MESTTLVIERKLLVGQLRAIATYPSLWGLLECAEVYAQHVFHILMMSIETFWTFEKTLAFWEDIALREFSSNTFGTLEICQHDYMVNFWINPTKTNHIIWNEMISLRKKLSTHQSKTLPTIIKWLDFLQDNRHLLVCPLYTDEVLSNLIIGSFVDEKVQRIGRQYYQDRCASFGLDSPNAVLASVGLKQGNSLFPRTLDEVSKNNIKAGVSSVIKILSKNIPNV